MKYFTIDNWIADQDLSREPATRFAAAEYEKYFESVRDRMPQPYLHLIAEWHLHDSRLAGLQVDSASQSAVMRLESWKHDRSGGDLVITYRGVIQVSTESDSEKGLPGPYGFGDLGYDEMEVGTDHRFEHRILFSSGIELRIEFTSLEYAEEIRRLSR